MTLPQDIIGVDIAKGWIDVFYLSTTVMNGLPRQNRRLRGSPWSRKALWSCLKPRAAMSVPWRRPLPRRARNTAASTPVRPANSPARWGNWPRPTGSMPGFWPRWARSWAWNRPRRSTPSGCGSLTLSCGAARSGRW